MNFPMARQLEWASLKTDHLRLVARVENLRKAGAPPAQVEKASQAVEKQAAKMRRWCKKWQVESWAEAYFS